MELFVVGEIVFLTTDTEKKNRPKYKIVNIRTKPLGHVEPEPEEFHNKNLDGVVLKEPTIYLEPVDKNQKLPRENPFYSSELELVQK